MRPRDPSWSRAILKGSGAPKYGRTTAAHAAAEAAEAEAEAARYAIVAEVAASQPYLNPEPNPNPNPSPSPNPNPDPNQVAASQLAECAAAGGVGPWYVGLVGDQLHPPPLPPLLDAAELDALVEELGSHCVRDQDAGGRAAAAEAAAAEAVPTAQETGAAAQALAAAAARKAAAWLRQHYLRDDNAVPPRCALAPPVAADAEDAAAVGATAGATAGAEAAEAAAAAQAVGAAAQPLVFSSQLTGGTPLGSWC